MWRLSAARYGKGGSRMEVIAPRILIVIADGREGSINREYRVGMTCHRGTTVDRIFRKLVREGRAEIVGEN